MKSFRAGVSSQRTVTDADSQGQWSVEVDDAQDFGEKHASTERGGCMWKRLLI